MKMQTVTFICQLQLLALVLSDVPPAPPQDIRVDNWVLTWTPSSTDRNTTYTVQYSKFDEKKWLNVKSCVHTSLNSCNVISTKLGATYGCVKIRVLSERNGLTSIPAEACSTQGDSCIPDFSLTARPGFLTVHLSQDHILAEENGKHAGYKVCYRKEQQQQMDCSSPLPLRVEEGQRYCVQVQYTHFRERVGLPSCMKCEDIPNTRASNSQTVIIVGIVVFIAVLFLLTVVYFFVFDPPIKPILQPPVQIPPYFLDFGPQIPLSSPIIDEECDLISEIISADPRGD